MTWNGGAHSRHGDRDDKEVTLAFRAQARSSPTFTGPSPLLLGSSLVDHRVSYYFT